MLQEAIAKVEKEITDAGNQQTKVIGRYVIDKLLKSEDAAEKVMNEKKTLKGCMDSIKAKAKERAVNQMAMIEDETVYGWAREYYGIKDKVISMGTGISLLDLM